MGLWTTSLSRGELDSGLGMVLFTQMFLASTGFLVRARRGHFDPLLVGKGDRTAAVMWHWIVSIAPGIAGWACLAGIGYFLGSPAALSALVGGRAVALFIVSALAWTAGFTLARGAAGGVWLAALLALLVRRTDLLPPASMLSASTGTALRHAVTPVALSVLAGGQSRSRRARRHLPGGSVVLPPPAGGLAILRPAGHLTGGPRMKTRLELAAVGKAFGRHQVLNQTWLQVREGEAVGLIGANGAGKTTLLRIGAGLVRPDRGSVRWSSMQDDEQARIRYYGGEMTLPPSVRARRWASLFDVAMDDRRRIGRLSRGSRQLFGLRVLLSGDEADLLLLDEPWEGLDPEAGAWLADTLRRWRSGGAGILISSHQLHDLDSVCARFRLLR